MSYYSDDELRELGVAEFGERVRVSKKTSLYGAERIRFGSDVRIDDFCVLSAGAGGIFIGNNVHVAVYSSLIGRGHIRIEDFANVSSRVSIYSSSDDYTGQFMTNPTVPEKYTGVIHADVTVCRHVIIGSGTVVLPGVVLAEGCAIGALSLVRGDCAEFEIYAGVPAQFKSLRKRALLDLEQEFITDKTRELII